MLTVITFGHTTRAIYLAFLDKGRVQLLQTVMGTKNKEIKHIFTGSVAERMFRKCPVSVISYRGGDIAAGLTKRIKKEMAKK